MKKMAIIFCAAALAYSANSVWAAKPTQVQDANVKNQGQSADKGKKADAATELNSARSIGPSPGNIVIKDDKPGSPSLSPGQAKHFQNVDTTAVLKNNGQQAAAMHHNNVASTVQNLLQVATEDPTVGPQVTAVADQEAADADTTSQRIEKIQTRNPLKTFLLGADYKNIGQVRSQMVHARNRIRQLTQLMNKTDNPNMKNALQTQIATMNAEQASLNSFLTDNEDKFSIFGWIAKLFAPKVPDTTDTGTDTGANTGTNIDTGTTIPPIPPVPTDSSTGTTAPVDSSAGTVPQAVQ